jgi:hypothetical protein
MAENLDAQITDLMVRLAKYHADNYTTGAPAYASEIKASRLRNNPQFNYRIIGNLFRLLKCFSAYNIGPDGRPNDPVEIRRVWEGENSINCNGCVLLDKCAIHNPKLALTGRANVAEVLPLIAQNPILHEPIQESPKGSGSRTSRKWISANSSSEQNPRIIGTKQKQSTTNKEIIDEFERSMWGKDDQHKWQKFKEEDPDSYKSTILFNNRFGISDEQDGDALAEQKIEAGREKRKQQRIEELHRIGSDDWITDMERLDFADSQKPEVNGNNIKENSGAAIREDFDEDSIQPIRQEQNTDPIPLSEIKAKNLAYAKNKGYSPKQLTDLAEIFDKPQDSWTDADWKTFEDFFNHTPESKEKQTSNPTSKAKKESGPSRNSKIDKIRKHFDKFDPDHTPGYMSNKGKFVPTNDYGIITILDSGNNSQISKEVIKALIPDNETLEAIRQALQGDNPEVLRQLLNKATYIHKEIITAYLGDDASVLASYKLSVEQARAIYYKTREGVIKSHAKVKAIDFSSGENRDTNTGHILAPNLDNPESLHRFRISADTETNYESVAYIATVNVTSSADLPFIEAVDPQDMKCYTKTQERSTTRDGQKKKGAFLSAFPFAHYNQPGQLFDLIISAFEGEAEAKDNAREFIMNLNPTKDISYLPSICESCSVEECALVGIYHMMKARMYRIGAYFRACEDLKIFIEKYDFENLWREEVITDDPEDEKIPDLPIQYTPGIVPEKFQLPPEVEYKVEQPFEIELVEDYRFHIDSDEDGNVKKVRYPNAILCRAANWPDPKYLELDVYKFHFKENTDPKIVALIKTLNSEITLLKSLRIESEVELQLLDSTYKKLKEQLIPTLPVGSDTWKNELDRELWGYLVLKTTEFQNREIIPQTSFLEIGDKRLTKLMNNIKHVYDMVPEIPLKRMIQIVGIKYNHTQLVNYFKQVYGSRSEESRQLRIHAPIYLPTEILKLYEVYLRPGYKQQDVANVLPGNKYGDQISVLFSKYQFPTKTPPAINREIAKQIHNLWSMTALPIQNIAKILVSTGITYFDEINKDFELNNINEEVLGRLRAHQSILGIRETIALSKFLIAENRRFQEKRNRGLIKSAYTKWFSMSMLYEQLGLTFTKTVVPKAIAKIGLWKLDTNGNETCEQGDENVIEVKITLGNKTQKKYKAVTSGNEYAIIDPDTFSYHPISRCAYESLRVSTEWNKQGNVGKMSEVKPKEMYKAIVPYPPELLTSSPAIFLNSTRQEIVHAINNMIQVGEYTPEP